MIKLLLQLVHYGIPCCQWRAVPIFSTRQAPALGGIDSSMPMQIDCAIEPAFGYFICPSNGAAQASARKSSECSVEISDLVNSS